MAVVRVDMPAEGSPFGELLALSGFRQPVVVPRVGRVGPKLSIAVALDRLDAIGIDLVNRGVNDILAVGAAPLGFLPYGLFDVPGQIEALMSGLARACQEAQCMLLGGTTVERPDVHPGDEPDVAGFIVGAVERDSVLDGQRIAAGDVLLGLPSAGLHSDGYALVRRVFSLGARPRDRGSQERDLLILNTYYSELRRTLGEELLEPHWCYLRPLDPVLRMLHGLAHVTTGGLVESLQRVLPASVAARLDQDSWPVPPIFELTRRRGRVADGEMYRTFNMGLGMIAFCAARDLQRVAELVPDALLVGEVVQREVEEQVLVTSAED